MTTKFDLGDVVYIPVVIDQITAKYNEGDEITIPHSTTELRYELLFNSKANKLTNVLFALEDELFTREDILNADKV